jgi:peroxiredoxin
MSEESITDASDRVGGRDPDSPSGNEPFLSGPATGRLLKPFALPSTHGETAQLTDYKQRSNMVLFLHHRAACLACRSFLGRLGEHTASYAEAETVVLGISADGPESLRELARELRLRFSLLSDPAGQIATQENLQVPALVITDRFGEVWAAWLAGDRHAFPSEPEVDDWLQFIELQCRECEAPEWPAISDERVIGAGNPTS